MVKLNELKTEIAKNMAEGINGSSKEFWLWNDEAQIALDTIQKYICIQNDNILTAEAYSENKIKKLKLENIRLRQTVLMYNSHYGKIDLK